LNKKLVWGIWGIFTVAIAAYYSNKLFWSEDKTSLLIGETTHGHYQIEMACSACHSEAFGGTESLQTACMNCHADELKLADDSHPKSKFTDPRNADRVEILDARYCITCHSEHQQDATLTMGLTIPGDYCYYCHQETLEERPSHEDLGFDTCATSGCHNYHDNRALYEDFLVAHANEPVNLESAKIPQLAKVFDAELKLALEDVDAPDPHRTTDIITQWQQTTHAQAGVNCSDCHQPDHQTNGKTTWIDKPGLAECQQCHEIQVAGYTAGKHGMRLSSKLDLELTEMSPAMAKLTSFKQDSINHVQNCNTCHGAHEFNIQMAAVSSCLSCHDDRHSNAFETSPHGKLWQQAVIDGDTSNAVSCATCHMPREDLNANGKFHVQHNQNANLRPNEKMIRGVCMNCHGLPFVIDALADQTLIDNNFNGQAQQHVPSIDWAIKREQSPKLN